VINVVSTRVGRGGFDGPTKVADNLVKGLGELGYPFVTNGSLRATLRLWVHDDPAALDYLDRTAALSVVGPNLFVMPSDIPASARLDGALYLHPSQWAAELWRHVGFDRCPIEAWATGVDTDSWQPVARDAARDVVLVMHKRRDTSELVRVVAELDKRALETKLLLYGRYTEGEYRALLERARFVVWHGAAESQGIALQEAMACNVPILLWDVTSLCQTQGGYPFDRSLWDFPATAAPYFDASCGLRFTSGAELENALERMLEEWPSFSPRQYVLENLSLEGQARRFVELWGRWGLTVQEGYVEKPMRAGSWRGRPLRERVAKRLSEEVKRQMSVRGLRALP